MFLPIVMVDLSTTAIIQARMASSRLPGNVLLDIAEQRADCVRNFQGLLGAYKVALGNSR
jgi:hypothetical protein